MTDQNEDKKNKQPPNQVIKSIQLDLFSKFTSNNINEVSNTVEYWESIPKYFLNETQQKKLRSPDGLAQSYTQEYTLRGQNGQSLPYKIKIQPALIEQPDGKDKAFFPSATEEIIEEVLKKIFTEQNLGIHDPKNTESWVKFSYSMIRNELYRLSEAIYKKEKENPQEKKPRYRRLRYDQIKHSLEIMSKCVLTVYEGENEIYTGAILQDYCKVDRKEYLNDTETLHIAKLPLFISHAINTLQYRQFNYLRYMECKEQLTRFIYKRLINRFINANYLNDYHFLYSDIKQASGLLQQKREIDNRQKVISSLEELKKKNVIISYKTEERKEGRKIIEVKYTVIAHPDFITEQKAANKRENDKKIASQKLSINVDK